MPNLYDMEKKIHSALFNPTIIYYYFNKLRSVH